MKNFHGQNSRAGFFEGWYLKHQSAEKTLALIPGFHRDGAGRPSAFLQIAADSGSWTVNFPASDFRCHPSRFAVRLGKNVFSEAGVRLDIQTPAVSCRGVLRYGRFLPPRYDVMGPFGLLPFLECNHGVLSLSHSIGGSLLLNGERLDFDGGRGYLEKDWGSSFPSRYLWVQSNRFADGETSIMLSVATIPFLGSSFSGCICSIWFGGREYRLATYAGVRILRWEKNRVVLRQGKYRLDVFIGQEDGRQLLAPEMGRMSRRIAESLSCPARFCFSENGKPIFALFSPQTSFEYSEK